MIYRLIVLLITIGLAIGACRTVDVGAPVSRPDTRLTPGESPGRTGLASVEPVRSERPLVINAAALQRIDTLLIDAIEERLFPASAVALGRGPHLAKLEAYGTLTYTSRRQVRVDSQFDLASLTKVVATTTAVMLLHEQDKIDIEAPVHTYLPEFGDGDKRRITVRHLLTHTSGLAAFKEFYSVGVRTRQGVVDSIFASELISAPGESYTYSDFGMIVLMLVIELITGGAFDEWCDQHIFQPLGMTRTGFRSTGETDPSVVPSELDDYFRNRLIQGEVHDQNAWLLGGVSGHAGLFSTARDLARFAAMMARGGLHGTERFLRASTIRYFTTVVDTTMSTRALGWDTRNLDRPSSAGAHFGPRSYGHTGFTGTSIWIDPSKELYAILLTNRVYPTRRNYAFSALRPLVADAAYEGLVGMEDP